MKITIDVEGTLCVECGPNVAVDGEGCCAKCGATAYGSWLQTLLVEVTAEGARALRARADEAEAMFLRGQEISRQDARDWVASAPLHLLEAWRPCGCDGCAYCETLYAEREKKLLAAAQSVRPSE